MSCTVVLVSANRLNQASLVSGVSPERQSFESSVTGFRVGCQKFDLYKFGKCGITLA